MLKCYAIAVHIFMVTGMQWTLHLDSHFVCVCLGMKIIRQKIKEKSKLELNMTEFLLRS